MNYLTIVFFERIATRVQSSERIVKKLRHEIIGDAKRRLHLQLLDTTLYLSAIGKSYQAKIMQWFHEAESLLRLNQAELLFKRLIDLETAADELHRETLKALTSPGCIDTEKLHFLYKEEHEEVSTLMLEAIKLDMFRIIASGGSDAISKLPLLKYVHPQVDQYYQYYTQSVLPALALIEHQKRYGIWAYQYREQARIGNLAKLPAYVETDPKKTKKAPLLGEQFLSGTGSSVIWQGVGFITNITPETVEEAQEQVIHTKISVNHLRNARLQDSPTQILNQYFHGEWYAVDPAHFYAMLTLAMYTKTLQNRKALGKCLYCGADGAESYLCLPCLSKVRQKI